MATEQLHDLTPAYALDALDRHERAAYEEHLRDCERCRDELARLGDTAALLGYGAPAAAPPLALRKRILEAAGAERGRVIEFPRRRYVVPSLAAAAAAAAAVAIGLGAWAASLSGELDELRTTQEILADPEARSVELDGAQGRLVVDPDGNAALVANLGEAPRGKTYEVWVIEDRAPRRAGLFDDAGDPVRVEERVPRGATVAVTVERDGGVDEPTGTPIFTAQA
jgi:anti-sigma-K factor RskA